MAAAAQFVIAALAACFAGVFMAARFLPVGGGATRRVLRVLSLAFLVMLCGAFWGAAAGLVNFQGNSGPGQSLGTAGNYGMAVGLTAGAGLVIVRRIRGPWRAAASAGQGRVPIGRLRPAQRAIRVIDYVVGVVLCNMLLSYPVLFSLKQTEVSLAHWLDGFLPSPTAGLAARGGLMLTGFLYAQLISGGAIKALNMALRSDWAVSRKWNYLLLVPPFALIAPFAVVAAVVAPGLRGLLGGIAVHFATLYAGYRYTSEPPGTTLQTLKLLRRRASRRPAPDQAKAAHPAAGRPTATRAAAERPAAARGLDELRRAFLASHAADPRARVSALEQILNELFAISGLPPERPFARHGEQVDGQFTHRGIGYTLAARWPAAADRASLVAFGRKPPGDRPGPARLLLSISGFTPGVHQAYSTSAPILAMDGGHLMAVLEQWIGLSELLDRMKRHVDQTGHPYLPASQALET
jgi:hypothetical protein